MKMDRGDTQVGRMPYQDVFSAQKDVNKAMELAETMEDEQPLQIQPRTDAFMVQTDKTDDIDKLLQEINSMPGLDTMPSHTSESSVASASTSTSASTSASTSTTATSASTSGTSTTNQSICILHWEEEATADRLIQSLGEQCTKLDFNNVIWERPHSFSSLYILVNDHVAAKFSKERVFETLEWIDKFADLGKPIHAVKCTENETSFMKTFYRLPESPEIYKWPSESQVVEDILNSSVQVGISNHCVFEADDRGSRCITQIASSTNIVDINIGDSNENTCQIVLTTVNDIPGLDKKLFTVYKDNQCLINTYLRTEAGATVTSVQRGSVILNLKLEQGVTLEEFLKVKLQKVLHGCLRQDLLRQVRDKVRLDVKVHSKLTLDMIGNLSPKKELDHKSVQTKISWVQTEPTYMKKVSQGSTPKPITVRSTPVKPSNKGRPQTETFTPLDQNSDHNSSSFERKAALTRLDIAQNAEISLEPPAFPVSHVSSKSGPSVPPAKSGASLPSAKSGASVPSAKSGASLPSAKSGASVPPAKSGASLPSAKSGASVPSAKPGASELSARSAPSEESLLSKSKGFSKETPILSNPEPMSMKYDTTSSMEKLLTSPQKSSRTELSKKVLSDQGSTYAPRKVKSCWKLFRGQLPCFERPKTKISGYFKIAERRNFHDGTTFYDTLYVGRSENVGKSLDEIMNSGADTPAKNFTAIQGYVGDLTQAEREEKITVFWVDKMKDRHECKSKSMLDCIKEHCGDCPEFNGKDEVWSEEDDMRPPQDNLPFTKQTLLTSHLKKRSFEKSEMTPTKMKKIKTEPYYE